MGSGWARFSFGEFRSGVEVVQNLFTGIPNQSRSCEIRMRLPGLYRMSEDGVYVSSVPSCTFSGNFEFEAARSRSDFGIEVAGCSIGVVRGVVQVIQNWFTGNPNLTRSLRLG